MILCVYAHAHVCVRGCVCVPSGLWVACCVAVLCVALVFGGVVLVFGGGCSLWVTPMHALDLWEPVTTHLGWGQIQWYLCSQVCVGVYMGLCVLWVYCCIICLCVYI